MKDQRYGKLSREWWMWKLQRRVLRYMEQPTDHNRSSLHELLDEYHCHYQPDHNPPAPENAGHSYP